MEWAEIFWNARLIMKSIAQTAEKAKLRCAIYTRKSQEEGLEQAFNSLDAQRLAGESYIASQEHEGWIYLPTQYNDGGYSGGNMERPALQKLLQDIKDGKIDCIVVYKIDRLTRSLLDFSKIIELLDECKCSFVAVTQSFNTSNSMGRLMLNVLLSFAQYERELTSERIRDKFAASYKQGIWMGGVPPLGYDPQNRELIVNEKEAKIVQLIYQKFLEVESVIDTARAINQLGLKTKTWESRTGKINQGKPFNKNLIRYILQNPIYAGKIAHKDKLYQGKHQAIIEPDIWEKVQALFTHREALVTKSVSRISTAPMLKGLLFCGCCGYIMSPTYCMKKNGTRYRYYSCASKVRGIHEQCTIKNISAGEVEEVVTAKILQILKSPEMVAQAIVHASNDSRTELSDLKIIEALKDAGKVWDELFPIEQMRITRMFIKKVILKSDGLDIQIFNEGLNLLTAELTNDINDKTREAA